MLRVVTQVAGFLHLHGVFLLFLIPYQIIPFSLLALTLTFTVALRLPHFLHFFLGLRASIILNSGGKAYGLRLRSSLLFGFSGGKLRVCASHVFLLLYYIIYTIEQTSNCDIL